MIHVFLKKEVYIFVTKMISYDTQENFTLWYVSEPD